MCLRFNITTTIHSTEINKDCGYTIRVNISDTNITYEQTQLFFTCNDNQIDGKIFDGCKSYSFGYQCQLMLYSDDEGVYCDISFPLKAEDINDSKFLINNIPDCDIICPIFISKKCDEKSIIVEINKSVILCQKTWNLVSVSLTSFDRCFLLKIAYKKPITLYLYSPDPYTQYQNKFTSTVYCYVDLTDDNESKLNIYLVNNTPCILKEGSVLSTIKTESIQFASKVICINNS